MRREGILYAAAPTDSAAADTDSAVLAALATEAADDSTAAEDEDEDELLPVGEPEAAFDESALDEPAPGEAAFFAEVGEVDPKRRTSAAEAARL